MSFRKEIKFRLTKSDLLILKNELLKKGMNNLYPKRIVHSCYFDTRSLSLFHYSDEGVLPRKKIRLRWYNNQKILFKECKYSSIEGRFKESNIFKEKSFEKRYESFFKDKEVGLVFPTLLVSYSREYFNYKKVRITFDYDINYLNLISKVNKKLVDPENVMEVKSLHTTSDEYIDSLINIQPSRFSKYCRGVILTNLQI